MAKKKKVKTHSRGKANKQGMPPRIWAVVIMAVVLLVSVTAVGFISYSPKDDVDDFFDFTGLEPPRATAADLEVLAECGHTGLYVEDGKNEPVENVAAILIRNNSDEFLDRATVVYDISGKEATFVATGLPPGRSAWVQEQNKMILGASEVFELQRNATKVAFTNTAVYNTDDLEVSVKNHEVRVTNISSKDLVNVTLYYKNLSDDGNYLGGITYVTSFESLGKGETLTKAASHLTTESEIVRFSYQPA